MTRKIYFLLLFFLHISLFAQEEKDIGISFREGDFFKTEHKKYEIDYRIGDNNGGAYLIFNRPGTNTDADYIVQHIDSDLIIDNEVVFDFNKERIVSHFLIDQNFHFITGVINKTKRQVVFKAYTTSDYGESYSEKEFLTIPIDDLGIEIGFSKFIQFLKPRFTKNDQEDIDRNGYLTFSNNKKFFALSFDVPSTSTDEHLFFVFTSNFELVFKKFYDAQVDDDNFDFVDIALNDKDGTLYLLSRNIMKKTFLTGGIREYNFELSQIAKDDVKVSTFSKNGISFGQIRLKIDETNNRLKAIGTFSEKSDYYDRGIAFIDFVDDSLENYTITLSPFSDKLLNQKFGNKKKKREFSKYFLRSILQKDSGNFVLISEELDIQSREMEFGTRNSDFFYQFKDILVSEISNTGNLLWSKNINKHQETSSLAYTPVSSFSASLLQDDLFIIFNAKKVLKKKKYNLFFSSTPTPAKQYVIKIDNGGAMSYTEFTSKNPKLLFASSEAMYSSEKNPNSLILQGQNLFKRQFLKIEFSQE